MNCQWTPNKAKGVAFFNQFPKNFLQPYAVADPAPSTDTVSGRLRPEGCEWYRRPLRATSELYSTLTENRQCLQNEIHLLDDNKIQTFLDDMEPMTNMLAKFHKDSEIFKTDEDSRELILAIANTAHQVMSKVRACVHVGGALFTAGLQCLVAHTVLTNPVHLADGMSFAPQPDPKFKCSKEYEDLFPLLYCNKTAATPQHQHTEDAHQNVRNPVQVHQPQEQHQNDPIPHSRRHCQTNPREPRIIRSQPQVRHDQHKFPME